MTPTPPAAIPVKGAASEPKREQLGRLVREEWVRFAREQSAAPKPSHVIGWDQLDPSNREVDCRIGEALYMCGVDESDEQRAFAAVRLLGWEPDSFEPHLDKCSPMALRLIVEILAPDTGDERKEMLSAYATKEVRRRLAALARGATPEATPAAPTPPDLNRCSYCGERGSHKPDCRRATTAAPTEPKHASPCPKCRAAAGQPCRGATGQPMMMFVHSERTNTESKP